MRKQDLISDILRQEIRQGLYPLHSRIPSQADLAKRFDVTTITVNKAINTLIEQGFLHRPPQTRLGTLVKSMRPYPQGFIAFIACPGFSDQILHGAIHAAEDLNYMLVPFFREPDYDQEKCLRKLQEGCFTGLLTTSRERFDTPIPTVYMDTYFPKALGLSQVRADCYHGGQLIADALLKAGHRNVAYCSFWIDNDMTRPRQDGFADTMRANGITDMDKRIFRGMNTSPCAVKNVLHQIMERFPKVTAIACWNDSQAIQLMQCGRDLGLDIGGQIALAGFGNLPAQSVFPFLTIDQHPEETGYHACSNLIAHLENPDHNKLPPLQELEVTLLHADRL